MQIAPSIIKDDTISKMISIKYEARITDITEISNKK